MLFLIILYIIVLRKFLKVLAVLFILIVSSGVVCAQENASDVLADDYNQILADSNNDVLGEPLKTFTDLKNDISGAVNVFEVTSDNKNGILINTTSLVINGNGHTIDASNQARIFLINASQLVINDLTFINANITEGSALLTVNSNVTTNNVVFKNSVANNGVISASGTKYLSNNDVFKDVTSTKNGVIKLYRSAGTFDNATFTSSKDLVWGFIYDNGNSALIVRNFVFANTTSNILLLLNDQVK